MRAEEAKLAGERLGELVDAGWDVQVKASGDRYAVTLTGWGSCKDYEGQTLPGQTIISASGIRRQESSNRAKAPIAKTQAKLTSKTRRTTGLDWHPILEWQLADVIAYLKAKDFALHEAYTTYGSSRVSCAFCILGSQGDIRASASCPDNHDIYREMVDLEIRSTFSFQEKWLGDAAPHLLSEEVRFALAEAKEKAALREAAEALIPEHLLFEKGWPTVMPTYSEAIGLAGVRREVAAAVGLEIEYTEPARLMARYADLMRQKRQKEEAA